MDLRLTRCPLLVLLMVHGVDRFVEVVTSTNPSTRQCDRGEIYSSSPPFSTSTVRTRNLWWGRSSAPMSRLETSGDGNPMARGRISLFVQRHAN
ncbi:hypothetical protein EDC04DRAFT_2833822 [Pisolithus marmoratus]|nr:hypothetical protein EDC04DRAFT_2833822 [Pisolithus marmoratus]